MNTDLDLCDGWKCNVRDRCKRYVAHLQAPRDEAHYIFDSNACSSGILHYLFEPIDQPKGERQ